MIYSKGFILPYNNISNLSYEHSNIGTINLYENNIFKATLELYTDKINNRYYIIINRTTIYLDTINKHKPPLNYNKL